MKKNICWDEETHAQQKYRKRSSAKQRGHSRSQRPSVFYRGGVFQVSEEFSSPNLGLVSLEIDTMTDSSMTVV